MFSFVAMSIGLKVLLYALAALLLAFLTYVILIGFSLFRYATRRTEESAPLNTAGATGDILKRNENAEAKKDHLLTLPHELWEMRQDQVTRSEEHTSELQYSAKYLVCRLLLEKTFFFNDTATTEIYTLSLHDALPILLKSLLSKSRSRMGVVI